MSVTLSQGDADFVRELVYRRAAIRLDASKQYLLEMRLEQLVREGGFESIGHLLEKARSGAPTLDTQIVEAITTHETTFFRDVHPFEALRNHILPPLIAARKGTSKLTIWSAACSTGQEPYSIAMLVLDRFPELAQWPVRILATDLSEKALTRARDARFTQLEVNRGLPAPMLVKHFERVGAEWQVKAKARSLVTFRQLNLLEPWNNVRADVVFMRNVLIYFDVATKKTILNRVRQMIAPDGALLLGTAETTFGIDDAWERVPLEKSTYYRLRP